MSADKITQDEAERLISMVKRSLIAFLEFPQKGKTKEFIVEGDTKQDSFTINIFRGSIKTAKYTFGARITKNGIMLLELDLNPTGVHINPDGTKINGNHWHIYTEKYGRSYAIPADDIENEQFVENTILFLDRFNVIEKPEITMQTELL